MIDTLRDVIMESRRGREGAAVIEHAYDDIGRDYRATRQPDPRVAAAIRGALAGARTVVNLGAGAGSYEPRGLRVVAVEPSARMLAQRPGGAPAAIQAVAESLPVRDGAFDAALAVLTIHHWRDLASGLAELRRVARRVVILTWDPSAADRFWLTAHYLPEIVELDRTRFPTLEALASHLPGLRVDPVPIPHDCRDGFLGAFWRRPEAYLLPAIRQGMSGFTQLPDGVADAGLTRLADDLRSGRWRTRFGAILEADSVDLGYRLVVA